MSTLIFSVKTVKGHTLRYSAEYLETIPQDFQRRPMNGCDGFPSASAKATQQCFLGSTAASRLFMSSRGKSLPADVTSGERGKPPAPWRRVAGRRTLACDWSMTRCVARTAHVHPSQLAPPLSHNHDYHDYRIIMRQCDGMIPVW